MARFKPPKRPQLVREGFGQYVTDTWFWNIVLRDNPNENIPEFRRQRIIRLNEGSIWYTHANGKERRQPNPDRIKIVEEVLDQDLDLRPLEDKIRADLGDGKPDEGRNWTAFELVYLFHAKAKVDAAGRSMEYGDMRDVLRRSAAGCRLKVMYGLNYLEGAAERQSQRQSQDPTIPPSPPALGFDTPSSSQSDHSMTTGSSSASTAMFGVRTPSPPDSGLPRIDSGTVGTHGQFRHTLEPSREKAAAHATENLARIPRSLPPYSGRDLQAFRTGNMGKLKNLVSESTLWRDTIALGATHPPADSVPHAQAAFYPPPAGDLFANANHQYSATTGECYAGVYHPPSAAGYSYTHADYSSRVAKRPFAQVDHENPAAGESYARAEYRPQAASRPSAYADYDPPATNAGYRSSVARHYLSSRLADRSYHAPGTLIR